MPNADVFISYRRDQREQVTAIVETLQHLGLSVWFDARLEAGTSFDEEINREVRTAKAVVVCWSPEAVQSRWVRAEASIGLERDVLVAVFLHPTELVPPYNLVHAANLEGWAGDPEAPAWRDVLGRIGKLVGRPHLVDEAVAKSMDSEWADRDREERAAFKAKLEEARRRFAANHEAQPAVFNQALADMATSFESWILRRRIANLGAAPDPLGLVADHSENLRIDLATAQRERDAAAAFAARGRGAGNVAAAPADVKAEKPRTFWGAALRALSVLALGPFALIAMNRRWLALAAVAVLAVAFVAASGPRIAYWEPSAAPAAAEAPGQGCYSHRHDGWFFTAYAERQYAPPPQPSEPPAPTGSASVTVAESPPSVAPPVDYQMYASREAMLAAWAAAYSFAPADPVLAQTPYEQWVQEMQASCEFQGAIDDAYASASASYSSSGSTYAYDSGFGALSVLAANFVAFLVLLVQGLLAARRDKRARSTNR